MDLILNGRVTLITGPAKGMGAAIRRPSQRRAAGWR